MDYASIKALAADTKESAMLLSGSSIALLLSAAEDIEDRYNWTGSGEYPSTTDAEWDDIQAMIARMELEVMSGLTGHFGMSVKVPEGALLCDGGLYQREDYPSLYEFYVGTTLIVDEFSFNVPDMRFRVPVGSDTTHPVLSSGGSATHQLTENELPAHSHSIGGSSTGLVVAPGELPVMTPIALPTLTGSVGLSQAHNNVQPYLAVVVFVWT